MFPFIFFHSVCASKFKSMLFVCDSLFLVQKFLLIDSFPNNKVNHQKKKTSTTKFVKLFSKQEIENRQKKMLLHTMNEITLRCVEYLLLWLLWFNKTEKSESFQRILMKISYDRTTLLHLNLIRFIVVFLCAQAHFFFEDKAHFCLHASKSGHVNCIFGYKFNQGEQVLGCRNKEQHNQNEETLT